MAERPKRIQRRRTKGWRLPPDAIYVGRPSRWGNPYSVVQFGRAESLATYARHVAMNMGRWDGFLEPLRGHDLACWCPLVDENGHPVPCHADVLLELANR